MLNTEKVILLLCAWVLWLSTFSAGPTMLPVYSIASAFDSRKECEEERLKAYQRLLERGSKEERSSPLLVCVPDTVDPRGRN